MGLVPLLLLLSIFHLTNSFLIFSRWRVAHIPSKFCNLSLPNMLWTNTFHSSKTEFRANLTISVGWGFNPTTSNEILISLRFIRNRSMCSPFYIYVDLILCSKYIFCYSEDPSYRIDNASHILWEISLLVMWHTMWSLTLLMIDCLAFTISALYYVIHGYNYQTVDICFGIAFIEKAWDPFLPHHVVGCILQLILISQPMSYHLYQWNVKLPPLSSALLLSWSTHSLLELVDLLLLATTLQMRILTSWMEVLWGRIP